MKIEQRTPLYHRVGQIVDELLSLGVLRMKLLSQLYILDYDCIINQLAQEGYDTKYTRGIKAMIRLHLKKRKKDTIGI